MNAAPIPDTLKKATVNGLPNGARKTPIAASGCPLLHNPTRSSHALNEIIVLRRPHCPPSPVRIEIAGKDAVRHPSFAQHRHSRSASVLCERDDGWPTNDSRVPVMFARVSLPHLPSPTPAERQRDAKAPFLNLRPRPD